MSALKQESKKYYTFEDWLSWDEDVRAEIVDGKLYMMAFPVVNHGLVSSELQGQIWLFLKGKTCKVFNSSTGVRLNEKKDTVVAPDIFVVCDKNKIKDKVIIGAPDLVIEILSPSTSSYDCVVKFNLYRENGVREYWIVDPVSKRVNVFHLENGRYVAQSYDETAVVPVRVLEGCEIDMSLVFDYELTEEVTP
jgi:Uma2 family endonuclease